MSQLQRKGIRGIIRTAVTADNPPSGQLLLYPKADGWYSRTSAGVEVGPFSAPGPWQAVTYATGITDQSTTYNGVQVRNNGNGTCSYRGRATSANALTAGATIWTVPVDCRPAKDAYNGLINSAQALATKTTGITTTAASLTAGTTIQAEGVTYSL